MGLLQTLAQQKATSENLRKKYEDTWSRAINLCKGRFRTPEVPYSDVRQREKMFFRKIDATIWRLVASMYQSFLKDPKSVKIEGRDVINDPHNAGVLEKMVLYRASRIRGLFLMFIWAFWDIFKHGVCYVKMPWIYEEKDGYVSKDGPEPVLYPVEQVFPDMAATTKEKMRYCHFLNYMTEAELEEAGYDNIKDMQPDAPESDIVRSTRYRGKQDPLQNPSEGDHYATGSQKAGGEYPLAGKYDDNDESIELKFYKIYESFYIEDGKWMMCVHNDFNVIAKKPQESPYIDPASGFGIPLSMGLCLTEAHQLIGEGFPELLEAPQESINYLLNIRKDNIAKSMSGHVFIDRMGNVDLQSLQNRRANGYTMMDDVNAVKHEQVPDVTRTAYMEASQDERMMDESSGVTPGLRGMEDTDKATVAQINYSESNAKIDLYMAIVGETFVKDFYRMLAIEIQLFEEDERIFRIANEQYMVDNDMLIEEVYDLGFDADYEISVGQGAGKETEVKQTFLAMDRAIMTLQATAQLMQQGITPPDGFKVPNIARLYEDLLPNIGKKNLKEYLITLPPPPVPQEGGQGGGGGQQPQQGFPNEANMIQGGSLGGI